MIFTKDFWKEIYFTISAQRTRCLLTMFCVFWGTFLFISVQGIFQSVNNGFVEILFHFDSEHYLVEPSRTTMPYKGMTGGRTWQLSVHDLQQIEKKFKGNINPYCGVNYVRGNQTIRHTERNVSTTSRILATYPALFDVMMLGMEYGRFVNQKDMDQQDNVCVLGLNVAKRLFGEGKNPCGKTVRIGLNTYKVIGVVKKTNNLLSMKHGNEDNLVIVPYTTGNHHYAFKDKFHSVWFLINNDIDRNEIHRRLCDYIKELHYINPQDKHFATLMSIKDYTEQWSLIFDGLDMMLWIIGLGLLIAGVLGIFNIMDISIQGRRREIGVRLAMGCNPNDLIKQIVCESLTLTFAAGYAGIMLGAFIIHAINYAVSSGIDGGGFLGLPYLPPAQSIGALLVMLVGGFLAGYMPSRKLVQEEVIYLLTKSS